MASPSPSSSTESSPASSVANSGWNIGIIGPVGDYSPIDIIQNRTGPQVPVYLFAVFPREADPMDPVAEDETEDDDEQEEDEQEEDEQEEDIETDVIVLGSDSEADSDSDQSVIYHGTYKKAQHPSDQGETIEDISEERDYGDHDERFRDHFHSN